jgi:DNA mismatch repair protein MutS
LSLDLPVKSLESAKKYPPSAKKLLVYAAQMQGQEILKGLRPFEERQLSGRMQLSPVHLQHLEIFSTYRGDKNGTLFWAIDRTRTSAGARTLKQWLALPLCDSNAIVERQDKVQFWIDKPSALKNLRETMGRMGDIERRMGKLTNPQCGPYDLKALEQSLSVGLEVSGLSEDWNEDLENLRELVQLISKTILEEPAVSKREGGFVKSGLRADLDEMIRLATDSQTEVLKLETSEKERTGISSLKIRYNSVFGYYIEITNSHKDKVPADYLRKQTLVNAERYVTEGLQDLERKVLSAKTRRSELELEVFESLRKQILEQAPLIQKMARHWAELDVFAGLAWLAIEKRYVRPRFGKTLKLELCRHPVIEQIRKNFVPNSISLMSGEVLCLTGPNMAGKSTVMRQVALIAVLAQLGSYVPAQSAELPIFDRIFTRIGASDALTEGLSTFMVEMVETSQIFRDLTERSLVVLDEIGRGTSTFDGMSLAQAILEELSEKPAITLFATHYHELTQLSETRPQIKNAHMAIQDKSGEIQFLHILESGPANRSYGIEVAKSAGLPLSLIKRAKEILKNKEATDSHHLQLNMFAANSGTEDVKGNSLACANPLEEELGALQVDMMTPIQALLKLQELKTTLQNYKENHLS